MTNVERFALTRTPCFIAVHYKQMLESESWPERINEALRVFELGLRTLALGLVSQYLIRDAKLFSDPELNGLLFRKLPVATLGTWQEVFFAALHAYEGKQSALFMPELYELYWDVSEVPHRPRTALQEPFTRLVQIRTDLKNNDVPSDDVGWEQLGRETVSLLDTVLAQFRFMENYELIRITGRDQEGWHFDLYVGSQIVPGKSRLTPTETDGLRVGCFYLSQDRCRFLELHPLLIFWEELPHPLEDTYRANSDIGLYESYWYNTVRYLTARVWEHIDTSTLVDDFARKVVYTLEKTKLHELPARPLTWWHLQRMAQAISQQRMGGAWDRYRADLYLQRDDTRKAFDRFLASKKACFVLTGKSGVGKSNFLLSLACDYPADQSSVCLLMYNGATIDPRQSLTAIVTSDFESRLRLTEQDTQHVAGDIWTEIGRIKDIENRQVVLIIDAVNENMDGRSLLRQINELIERCPWTWLKVVVTSRPEAWRQMKRGVKLAEGRYYREIETEDLGFEMQGFTYSQELTPFAKDELPRVYEKYCRAYSLQTRYPELPAELRAALRDPLVLRLVAETWRDKEIPENVKMTEIYRSYVDALITTERMEQRDVVFLEQELMPLMIEEQRYRNVIPASVIATARTSDGRRLYDLIHGGEILSSGQAVNISYSNLANAEILELRGEPSSYEIAFKYERFYDYYGGKRLLQVVDQRKNQKDAAYLEFAQQLRECPFLWGPLKTALVAELRQGSTELFVALAQIPDDTTRQALVAALSEYGRDDAEAVRRILHFLMELKRRPRRSNIFPLVQPGDIPLALLNARNVAMETATCLELTEILVSAACDASPPVRMAAAQYTHRLWNQNGRAGVRVLSELSKRAVGRFHIPRFSILESVIDASVLIALEHSRDKAQIKPLQDVWKRLLERLLLIRESETGLRAKFRKTVRESVVHVVTRLLVRLGQSLPAESKVNFLELGHFFYLGSTDKEKYKQLLPYLDPDYGDLKDAVDLLVSLVRARDFLASDFLPFFILASRSIKEYDTVTAVANQLFEEAIGLDPPAPAAVAVLSLEAAVLTKHPRMAGEALDRFGERVWELYDRSTSTYQTGVRAYQHPVIDQLIIRNNEIRETYYPDGFEAHLEKDKEGGQFILHRLLVGKSSEISLSQLDVLAACGYPALTLRVAELLTKASDPVTQEGLYELLARLRVSHQDLVDDFVEEFELQQERVRQAEAAVSGRTIGDTLVMAAQPWLATWHLSPQLCELIRTILADASECYNMNQFIELSVKRIVNFVYGSCVFEVP